MAGLFTSWFLVASAMTTRAAIAIASATTTVATTAITAVSAVVAAGFAAGSEVTEFARDLAVEGILETDRLRATRATATVGRCGLVRGLRAIAHRRQRNLALVVDVVDADFEFLPESEHVLDVVDALAAT
ncbi:MAG: hypothetical protein RL391_1110, partial [Actinomycetota bacterium]